MENIAELDFVVDKNLNHFGLKPHFGRFTILVLMKFDSTMAALSYGKFTTDQFGKIQLFWIETFST